MATRGRKPRPARAASKPATPRGVWGCPEHLDGDAAAAWAHLVGLLADAGNLDRTDPMIVEAYAINVALLREAHRSLGATGVLIEDDEGRIKASPAANVVNTATMRIKAICYDLGLVPATSKYGADPGQGGAAADPMAKILSLSG